MRIATSRWWALGAFLAGGFIGCSSGDDAPTTEQSTEDPLATMLARDTGVAWAIERDAAGRVILALPLGDARPTSSSASPADAARDFYRRYGSFFGITAADDELRVADVRDHRGSNVKTVVFDQRASRGALPVWNAGSAIHVLPDGSIAWAQPTFVPGTASLPRAAAITPAQATAFARDAVARAMPGSARGALARAPELGVVAAADGPHLAYAVAFDAGSAMPLALVDAASGRVLSVRDTVSGLIATAYTAKHYLPQPFDTDEKRSFFVLPPSSVTNWSMDRPSIPNLVVGLSVSAYVASVGDVGHGDIIAADLTSDRWDDTGKQGAGSAVDAYTNITRVIDWYGESSRLGYRSFDGQGSPVRIFVHRDLQGAAAGYVPGDDSLGFDDVAPSALTPPAVALDMAAHEFTHAVTNHSAGIGVLGTDAYEGPFDEALADIFAATLEHDLSPGPGNMLLGESLSPQGKRAYRDHLAPASPDVVAPQQDALPDPNWADWARNRYDSAGIPTKAWSLMVMGGEHRGIGMPSALGWELSRDLFWQTLRSLRAHPAFWSPRLIALGQVAAGKLRKLPMEQLDTVACAWIAVNALGEDEPLFKTFLGRVPACQRQPAPTPMMDTGECAGHGDATICASAPSTFAFVCKNGVAVSQALCADLAQQCQRASASDPTATLSTDGSLICE